MEQSSATEPASDLAPWQVSVKNSVDIVRTTREQKRFEQSAVGGCMRCRMVCEGFKAHFYHEYMVHLELGPGIIHLRPETHSDNFYQIRSLQFYVLPGMSI